jgi:hypothetical protein
LVFSSGEGLVNISAPVDRHNRSWEEKSMQAEGLSDGPLLDKGWRYCAVTPFKNTVKRQCWIIYLEDGIDLREESA